MNQREIIAAVARRLPHRTQRDVAEIVELLGETWADALAQGHSVTIPDVGTLTIEVQALRAGGVLRGYGRLRRLYGRFRPTVQLKQRLTGADDEQT